MGIKKIAGKVAKVAAKEAGEHLLTTAISTVVPGASCVKAYKPAKYIVKGLKKLKKLF